MKRDAQYISYKLIVSRNPIPMKIFPELNDEFIFNSVAERLNNVGFELRCNYNDDYFYLTAKIKYEDENEEINEDTSIHKDCAAAIILLWFELIYKFQQKSNSQPINAIETLVDMYDNNSKDIISDETEDQLKIGNVITSNSNYFQNPKPMNTSINKDEFINKYYHKFANKSQLENRILPILRNKKFIKMYKNDILPDSSLLCYINNVEMSSRINYRTLEYIANLSLKSEHDKDTK